MEYIPKFIKDKGYDMEEEFMDFFHELDPYLAFCIASHIDENVVDIEPNENITTILGGVVQHEGEAICFALELMRLPGMVVNLTDLTLISMDEYLDLINLNSYIKSNERSFKKKKNTKTLYSRP